MGDDRIEATRLGIRNLERVMGYIVDSTTETGGDFSQLAKMYMAVLGQRQGWLMSVTKLVGGVEESRTLAGRGGDQFTRVSPDRQRAAVAFVMENLETPSAFLASEVLNQLTPVDAAKPLLDSQTGILSALMDNTTISRLADGEALDPQNAYTAAELLADVQAGLFSELDAEAPRVDPLRRSLQRGYVERLMSPFGNSGAADDLTAQVQAILGTVSTDLSDLRAAARMNLVQLQGALDAAIPNTTDPATLAHLEDMSAQISAVVGE